MNLVGDPSEIEDLFSDAQWAQVSNVHWSREDRDWSPEDFRAMRGEGKFSERIHELIKTRSQDAPMSKAALLPTLAAMLVDAGDIPQQLRDVFANLLEVTDSR